MGDISIRNDDAPLPMLRARPSELAPRALVVGDPARAAMAAAKLDASEKVAANREYESWTGRLGSEAISVVSHGIGAAGAGVCFEELARAGVQTIVRAGTCGALDSSLSDGDLVIATGAVRDEGLTGRLVPEIYPAVADHQVTASLVEAARAQGAAARCGVVLTTDLFYPGPLGPVDWELWQRSRVLAVEMEVAALLVIASLHGIRAGAVVAVDGNPTTASQDMSEYDPYRESVRAGTDTMIGVALEALACPAHRRP